MEFISINWVEEFVLWVFFLIAKAGGAFGLSQERWEPVAQVESEDVIGESPKKATLGTCASCRQRRELCDNHFCSRKHCPLLVCISTTNEGADGDATDQDGPPLLCEDCLTVCHCQSLCRYCLCRDETIPCFMCDHPLCMVCSVACEVCFSENYCFECESDLFMCGNCAELVCFDCAVAMEFLLCVCGEVRCPSCINADGLTKYCDSCDTPLCSVCKDALLITCDLCDSLYRRCKDCDSDPDHSFGCSVCKLDACSACCHSGGVQHCDRCFEEVCHSCLRERPSRLKSCRDCRLTLCSNCLPKGKRYCTNCNG